ncbi:MAG: hypothetical protein J1F11_13140 [Oscillospiraceae bacterium]|nr:hypothetical protein [Oscillospiraceae bacterium]
MEKRLIKHGNQAKADPEHPQQINGMYCTNIITCNKTLPDGSVVNVLEDNAEMAREEVDNIRLS